MTLTPLEMRHHENLIWREPPVILDAKYYLEGSDPANTHGPIKKMLGDMTLLDVSVGALFFPQIAPPEGEAHITRTIRRTGKQYYQGAPQIHLYQLAPTMSVRDLQERLRAILDLAAHHLPERPASMCLGSCLDIDTVNGSRRAPDGHNVLCPKPHIGPGVFDLVNVDTDCLKNPRLCHVIGQPIVPPTVIRAIAQEQLVYQSNTLRGRNDERLHEAERSEDDELAQQ